MSFMTKQLYDKYLNAFPTIQRKTLAALLPDPSVGAGASAVSTVWASEARFGIIRQTTLTLTAVAQTVVNGTEHQGTKIYDWPEGQILVYGCIASIAQTTTSDPTTTLNASVTGAMALGTATSSSTTLNSTMANIAPSTAFTSSATINVAGTAVTPFLAAPILINGTGTAADLYLNTAYATTTDVDADATQTLTGRIILTWANLADI